MKVQAAILHGVDIIDVTFDDQDAPQVQDVFVEAYTQNYGATPYGFSYEEQRTEAEGKNRPIIQKETIKAAKTYVVRCNSPHCCRRKMPEPEIDE